MYVNIAKSTTTTDRENDCSTEKAKLLTIKMKKSV